MKIFHAQLLRLVYLAALLFGWAANGLAQDLSVTASTNQFTVGQNFTYTIGVTNHTGGFISRVVVTNILPVTASFVSASNPFGSISTNISGTVVYEIISMPNDSGAVMTTVVKPATTADMTNIVVLATNLVGSLVTNIATNILVTPAFIPIVELGGAIRFPDVQILTNDWVTYSLSVTNTGSTDATGVVLSNRIPADVGVISVTPPNSSFVSNSLIFNLGSLTAGQSKKFQVRVQPTNAGPHTFSATLSSTTASLSNQTGSVTINVLAGLGTNLAVSVVSAQQFNPQTGLMEQVVNLTNTGTNSTASARVNILGFSNWVYNAAGTNNGHPFALFSGTLAPASSIDLVLKYFIPSKSPVPNPTLSAVEVPFFNPSVPAGTNVTLNRTNLTLASGNALIEFPSVSGRQYTILYMDSSVGTNWMVVQPRVTAPANRVQWIDDGPPATVSKPISATARFYRVIANDPL